MEIDNLDIDVDKAIEGLKGGQYKFALKQEAIREAIKNGIIVITGGPGTGKTTIIKHNKIFQERFRVSLAAPTGRAAKHD